MTNLSTTQPPTQRPDPTAHNVGQSGYVTYQREKCLAAVRDNPGCTAAEIAVLRGIERCELSLRLPELCKDGLVVSREARTCNVMGEWRMTWWLVEQSA